ncbi:phosphoribosylformylglycinamidine synthase subunit PurL [Aurantimonas sp. C2-6-R+9]|uniref:phosphoribosylformylglycinamidine synthase subunit PurL n=1 Tax=unclassified Aurantimonas TaxID=2638230 RepID=UPI002E184356|nr:MULTISPECIES: phosphoribosylformylglycinamidine synthase subunit PurL [unclassified Aurantimonas]MEC5291731.1 phosphoribosylformylglycinamidine synthase subunit PurL [Aurantimonas sp. C2-3-R2]MEC5381912.1 phosphoribosylformylglycinamidine synthase subunit PurL [Aurantimonas sp. C2-6-R+9]MEC5412815.1 phosphoribosylformylglycinamidine synthase subunit PurL [Aurantimonas sp. C2-4-R8]
MTAETDITPELIAAHGLKPDEYERVLSLIGREPTMTELGIFSAMWNEHCSYKSSKRWLRTLPTKGPRVIQGPGENAGVVDIGDGMAVVFKMESHNHPSFIEPYQGAATGVGGILRDVFTMGARPIAAMNALRFGAPDHPKTRHLVAGVVAGVGGYGNSFGVPTVGGEVNFHSRYNGNCLVNAFAAGLARTDSIFLSEAKGVSLPVVYLGAKTGRDGVGGATMASAEFDENIEEKRPTVQVGDPFTEKCLLEACLELMQTGAVIAIQDMGAAGLTCSAVEMGAKGGLGIELDLDKVPVRETAMTPYEMMLSESQERMLMVLDPDKREVAEAIFVKWGLDFAIVGRTTDDLRFRILFEGREVGNLPIKELGDEAPEYDRPWIEPKPAQALHAKDIAEPANYGAALLSLLGSPDLCSRRWVFEQYDTLIQGNSLQRPGGDAGVVRVDGHPTKALAFSSDVTPRYCEADPFQGGAQAVAECWRNLTAVGAEPLAATDNLNFGNPEKPELMGQFVKAVEGIGAACEALAFPIVSGNVSLYNETNGEAILPTPTIGGVGLIDDRTRTARVGGLKEGDILFLVGRDGSHLGATIYLREIEGREAGAPPPVDLAEEKRNGDFVRGLIRSGRVATCHDLSDGGLAVAVAEMCMASDRGTRIDAGSGAGHALLFGEDQARYVVAIAANVAEAIETEAAEASVPVRRLGVAGGSRLVIDGRLDLSVAALTIAHESWFPSYMSGEIIEPAAAA